MERTIFFHEDDYGQIELLPASAWAYCQQRWVWQQTSPKRMQSLADTVIVICGTRRQI